MARTTVHTDLWLVLYLSRSSQWCYHPPKLIETCLGRTSYVGVFSKMNPMQWPDSIGQLDCSVSTSASCFENANTNGCRHYHIITIAQDVLDVHNVNDNVDKATVPAYLWHDALLAMNRLLQFKAVVPSPSPSSVRLGFASQVLSAAQRGTYCPRRVNDPWSRQ